jgi:hypothetical protein
LIQRVILLGLALSSVLALSACERYDGYTRYPCQEFQNWEKAECQKPECEVAGVCTEDLLGDIIKPKPKE